MFTSLKEALALFKAKHPEISIGKSKFAQLRPENILPNSKLPHTVCMCKYHENFINSVNCLSKVVTNLPPYSHDFPNTLICKAPTENCWLKKCEECNFEDTFLNKCNILEDNSISWYVWKSDNFYDLTAVC